MSYTGYLTFGDREVINNQRTMAYVSKAMPTVRFLQDCGGCPGIWRALNHSEYSDPATDGAPWFDTNYAASARFLGVFATKIEGLDDSTHEAWSTELAGDGAVHSMSREGSKEIRVRATLFAEDDEAMNAGLSWLREVLTDDECGQDVNCQGQDTNFFSVCPGAPTVEEARDLMAHYDRYLVQTYLRSGVRVTKEFSPQRGSMIEVEFILGADIPWAFTRKVHEVTTAGKPWSLVDEQPCETDIDTYDALIIDPMLPLARPPRPPLINPVEMPPSWYRYLLSIPRGVSTENWGRLVPLIDIAAGDNARRNIRVRFYSNEDESSTLNVDECDYLGEFYVPYVPAHGILRLDGRQRTAEMLLGSVRVPSSHLVSGADGRPVRWPEMGCRTAYHVTVDSATSLSGSEVKVLTYVRE